jgi:CDP-glucose 4,6-dehydratase
VLLNERPVIRSDGKFVRDYFYVEDAVEAYLQFAEQMDRRDLHGEAFNFGTETPVTVTGIVAMILKLMGREDMEPVILNQATHEIREQYLDCAKAKKALRWKARYPLEEGLKKTIDWYQEYTKNR